MVFANSPIAAVDTTQATLGNLLLWTMHGTASAEAVANSLEAVGPDHGFVVPAISNESAVFAAIMRGYYHVRYKCVNNIVERELLVRSIKRVTRRKNANVVFTVNLAAKAEDGETMNDLAQVGFIVYDANEEAIKASLCDELDPVITDTDIAHFHNLVGKITAEFESRRGQLSAVEINMALTNFVNQSVGSLRIIGNRQDWFVPNIPRLERNNPLTVVNEVVAALKASIPGLTVFQFSVSPNPTELGQMVTVVKSQITERLASILEELDGAEKMNRNRLERLESEAYGVGHTLVVYDALVDATFKTNIEAQLASIHDRLNTLQK